MAINNQIVTYDGLKELTTAIKKQGLDISRIKLNSKTTALEVTGATTLNNSLTVTGATTLNNSLTVTGAIHLGYDSIKNLLQESASDYWFDNRPDLNLGKSPFLKAPYITASGSYDHIIDTNSGIAVTRPFNAPQDIKSNRAIFAFKKDIAGFTGQTPIFYPGLFYYEYDFKKASNDTIAANSGLIFIPLDAYKDGTAITNFNTHWYQANPFVGSVNGNPWVGTLGEKVYLEFYRQVGDSTYLPGHDPSSTTGFPDWLIDDVFLIRVECGSEVSIDLSKSFINFGPVFL